MLITALVLALCVGGGILEPAVTHDTTFAVGPDARLSIDLPAGSVRIHTWSRAEVRVVTGEAGNVVEVSRSGAHYRVRPARRRAHDEVDLTVTVPATLPVHVAGIENKSIHVEGLRASVHVETVEGNVRVDGGRGGVEVFAIEGSVSIRDVIGAVSVEAGDGDVRVENVRGDIHVEGIDGDIRLIGVEAERVFVETVDGDIRYDGPLARGGRYSLATHDGDVTLAIAQDADATVSVTTHDGALRSTFAIPIRGARHTVTEFSLGNGSALVELASFDGGIYLVRPGEAAPDSP